LTGSW